MLHPNNNFCPTPTCGRPHQPKGHRQFKPNYLSRLQENHIFVVAAYLTYKLPFLLQTHPCFLYCSFSRFLCLLFFLYLPPPYCCCFLPSLLLVVSFFSSQLLTLPLATRLWSCFRSTGGINVVTEQMCVCACVCNSKDSCHLMPQDSPNTFICQSVCVCVHQVFAHGFYWGRHF